MSVVNFLLIALWNSLLVGASMNVDIVTTTAANHQFCANGSQTLCITLLQCLSSVSDCISENSTLSFEAGIHSTVGLSGMMLVENISNVSLLGRNSTIQCEIGVGFLFKEMNHLLVRGLDFMDCGAELDRSVVLELFPSQNERTFQGAKSAIIVANSYNVNISFASIGNSYGFGLFAVNLLGQSGIDHSIITQSNSCAIHRYQNNFHQCENPNNLGCSGGGLVLVYDRCRRCFSGNHKLEQRSC